MKKYATLTASILLLLSTVACEKTEDSDPLASFDRKAMLGNLANNLIIPTFQRFREEADQLRSAAATFASSPTEENLNQVQVRWRNAAAAWKRAELYKMGPVEDQFLGVAIEYSPISVAGIESAITNGTAINNSYVESKGTNLKGLVALEYLLFDAENGNKAVLDRFTTADQATPRLAYLQALTENLATKANTVLTSWKESYGTQFTNADGQDISSSLGLLTNAMVMLIENIEYYKLGKPLGKFSSGTPEPASVEAGASESSISHIRENVLALENTFLGKSANGQDGSGLDDLLDAMDAQNDAKPLSGVIKAKFAEVQAKLNAIDRPLQQAVVQTPQTVEEVYKANKELIVLLKVDMASKLGVLITFNDNDGD